MPILPFYQECVEREISLLKMKYPTLQSFARKIVIPIRMTSGVHGDINNLGSYDLSTEILDINYRGIKNHCNSTGQKPSDMLAHVLSHEVLHGVLHQQIGIGASMQFDNIAGKVPITVNANFNGID